MFLSLFNGDPRYVLDRCSGFIGSLEEDKIDHKPNEYQTDQFYHQISQEFQRFVQSKQGHEHKQRHDHSDGDQTSDASFAAAFAVRGRGTGSIFFFGGGTGLGSWFGGGLFRFLIQDLRDGILGRGLTFQLFPIVQIIQIFRGVSLGLRARFAGEDSFNLLIRLLQVSHETDLLFVLRYVQLPIFQR